MNKSEKIMTFFIVILMLGLFGPVFYIMIKNSMDDSYYTGKIRTENNSIQTDILKNQRYQFVSEDKKTVFMNNEDKKDSVFFEQLMTTYDGKSFAYNEKDLKCTYNGNDQNYNNDMPKQRDAYKEIISQNGDYAVQIYTKTATTGGRGSASPLYYKERLCFNIHPVVKE